MSGFVLSRRKFTAGAFAAAGMLHAQRILAANPMSVGQAIEGIRQACAEQGVKWAATTVDTVKVGNLDVPLKGIASTFMANLAVLHQAVREGANLIVSHEPIFYNHFDDYSEFADDPIVTAKIRFAEENGLTVWRFHDHWHQIKPEPMSFASIAELEWEQYLDVGSQGFRRTFTRPVITLEQLAEEIAARSPSSSVRVIGRRDLPVRKIVNIGHNVDDVIAAFRIGDVAIAPEIREWDSAELARDVVEMGGAKGLVLIAHQRGEEGGMRVCRDWLAQVFPQTKVAFIDSGEPFTLLT